MLDVPLLSNTVRGIIVDQLSYYMVLPNKLPVQLAQNIDMTAFKYPQPAVSISWIGYTFLMFSNFRLSRINKVSLDEKVTVSIHKTVKTQLYNIRSF